MLIYSDNEAYGAYHYTGEEFGCVHFEKQMELWYGTVLIKTDKKI